MRSLRAPGSTQACGHAGDKCCKVEWCVRGKTRRAGAGWLLCEPVCPQRHPSQGAHQPAGVQGRSDAAERVAQGVAQVEVCHLQVRGGHRRWPSCAAGWLAWHWQRQAARRVQGMRTARGHLDAPVLGHEQVAGGEVAVQDGRLPRMQGMEALGSINCLLRGGCLFLSFCFYFCFCFCFCFFGNGFTGFLGRGRRIREETAG